MMIKHFLTICAAATVAAAGTSLAQAQSYPVQQVPSYGAPAEYRPGDRTPNFDALEDDDDAMPQASLPPHFFDAASIAPDTLPFFFALATRNSSLRNAA